VLVVDGGGVGVGSSRIPCLNSLIPLPIPRIISGIFLPPKRTSITNTTMAISIGESKIANRLSACCHIIRPLSDAGRYLPIDVWSDVIRL
jgi:hypothetical protein